MKPVTVVAVFEARPGCETELKQLLLSLIEPTRKEAGCLNYDLHVSADHPARFLFYENWSSRPPLEAHLKSAHMIEAFPRINDLSLAAPEITFWEKLA